MKFDAGGNLGSLPPMADYTPLVMSGGHDKVSSVAVATSEKEEDEGLKDSEIVKVLDKLDALPNDRNRIGIEIMNLLYDKKFNYSDTNAIAAKLAQIKMDIASANTNKKEFDRILQNAEANGSYAEYAVTSRGEVVGRKGDDYQLMSPAELKASGYTPVTNAELLIARKDNQDLAFNTRLLNQVIGSIGMKDVNEYVKNIISGLGTNQSTDEGFFRTDPTVVIAGLENFKQAVQKAGSVDGGPYNSTVDNLYNWEIVNSSQASQMKQAFAYILASLPPQAQALLEVKGMMAGGDGQSLLEAYLGSQISSSNKFNLSVDTPTVKTGKDGSKTVTDGIDAAMKMDPATMLEAGYGQEKDILIQTGEGGSYGIAVPTIKLPIVGEDKKPIGVTTLADVAKSGYAGYLDFDSVSMGGAKISQPGFQNVVVDGSALYTAYLPIDQQVYRETGDIRPDISMLSRYKQAQQIIRKQNIKDPDEINKIFKQHSLPLMYGENGEVFTNYYKFGIINGQAISQAFDEDAFFADYLSTVSDKNAINNVLSLLQKGRGDKDRIDFRQGSWLPWVEDDKLYKGTIFIPVNQNPFNGMVGFGNYPTRTEAEKIEAQHQAKPREDAATEAYKKPTRTLQ